MGTSILIVLIGMLVPVLAAAPFYLSDRRDDRRPGVRAVATEPVEALDEDEPAGQREDADPAAAEPDAESGADTGSAACEIPEARQAPEDGELPVAELEQAEVSAQP